MIALLLRLIVSPFSANSWDMYLWFETAQKIIVNHEVFDFYTSNPSMHYALPPIWAYYLALVYFVYPATDSDNILFRFLAYSTPMSSSYRVSGECPIQYQ